jgi:hypothetical protein
MLLRKFALVGTAGRSAVLTLLLLWSAHALAADSPTVSLLDNPQAAAPNPEIQKVLQAIDAARIEAS